MAKCLKGKKTGAHAGPLHQSRAHGKLVTPLIIIVTLVGLSLHRYHVITIEIYIILFVNKDVFEGRTEWKRQEEDRE